MASNDNDDLLLKNVTKDFTSLLDVKEIKEKERFIESLDQVLVKLEKTVDDVDLMRIDSAMTLDTTMHEIRRRTQDLEGYFDKIDKMEAFMRMVKGQVNELEKAVDKAESTMRASPIKRALSAIPFLNKIKPDTNPEPSPKYEPMPIFDSNLFFKTSPNETNKTTVTTTTTKTVTETTTGTTTTITSRADVSTASSSSLSSLSSSSISGEPLMPSSMTPTTSTIISKT